MGVEEKRNGEYTRKCIVEKRKKEKTGEEKGQDTRKITEQENEKWVQKRREMRNT